MAGIMSEGSATRAQSTLSVETTHVQVLYPFHPLHGITLQLVRRPKRGDGVVTVLDAVGKRLKIPVWMLLPDCADIQVAETPNLNKEALVGLADLLNIRLSAANKNHDNLLETVVAGRKGGERGATAASGTHDKQGKRGSAHRSKGADRTDRSHGAHSGDGISSSRRKS